MKSTISYTDLAALLKGAGVTKLKKTDVLTIAVCASRIFVGFRGDVAGTETVALSDGAVTLPAKKFQMLLQTYKGTLMLTIEGSPDGFKIQNFTMPNLGWDPNPTPPGAFKIFPAQPAIP